jgi:hypothetical protein
MKHQSEMNELKFKMHLMEQQYNHRNMIHTTETYIHQMYTFQVIRNLHHIRIYNNKLYNIQHQECIVHLYLIQEISKNTLRYLVIRH